MRGVFKLVRFLLILAVFVYMAASQEGRYTQVRSVLGSVDVAFVPMNLPHGRMPPAVAERVELLHVAELDSGLAFHPLAQADLEGTVRARREWTKRQRIPGARPRGAGPRHEDMRLLIAHHDDGRVQAELDLRVVGGRFLGGCVVVPSADHGLRRGSGG